MTDTKPWYLSAGVWGAIVSLLASLLSLFKVQLDPRLLDDLRDWMLALATLVASAVALYGRLRASRRITLGRPLGAATHGAAKTAAPSSVANLKTDDNHASAPTQNWRMNHVLVATLLLSPLLARCGGCQQLGTILGPSPAATYVAADRATFEAVGPEYAAYVHADPSLDDDERARRDRTVQSWRLRIESAERGAGKEKEQGTEAPTPEGTEGQTRAGSAVEADHDIQTSHDTDTGHDTDTDHDTDASVADPFVP